MEDRAGVFLEVQEAAMNIIEGIVDGFIMTVGITPPSPERKRNATIFIAAGLFGTLAGAIAFIGFMVRQLFMR
jgi:hypothetical protein